MNAIFKNKIKNKKGNAIILSSVVILFGLFFTILFSDFYFAYSNKLQLQNISDATATGAAHITQSADKTIVNERSYLISTVDQRGAPTKANEIINANKVLLNKNVDIVGQQYNRPRTIDGKFLSDRNQYYTGNFTVELAAKQKTLFNIKGLFGSNIDTLNYKAKSRVHITPYEVP